MTSTDHAQPAQRQPTITAGRCSHCGQEGPLLARDEASLGGKEHPLCSGCAGALRLWFGGHGEIMP